MIWQQIVLLVWLGINATFQFYLVDRPRDPKTMTEAVLAVIELGLIALLVISIS